MKDLKYFENFKTNSGKSFDFQCLVDYDEETVEIIAAYEHIGNEIYQVMHEFVFDNDDLDEIHGLVFS